MTEHAPSSGREIIVIPHEAAEAHKIRTFGTGANRDTADGKHDYRGYLSPLVMKRFGEYMTKHRVLPDGTIRSSDNWKKGIPLPEYLSSLLRHVVDLWLLHEGQAGVSTQDVEEALCGILFNTQGYLHEQLRWPPSLYAAADAMKGPK